MSTDPTHLSAEPDAELDAELARLAASSRAPSFGPYFADRVMTRVRESAVDERPRASWQRLVTHASGRRPRIALRAAALGLSIVIFAAAAVALDGLRWRVEAPAPGQVAELELADGTIVSVASGSELRYRPFRFREERRVQLSGEAFFTVASEARPFLVETFNAEILVTGTRFNVRAWEADESAATEVALVEGGVLLRSRANSRIAETQALPAPESIREVHLSPGETARVLAAGALDPAPIAPAPETVATWREGGIVYQDRPLSDVLSALERRFAVRIHASRDLIDGRTATYINPDRPELAEVLDALSFALDLRFSQVADGWQMSAGTDSGAVH